MKDSTKNIELIDRFIANEKKSKMWTVINVGIFCLLGLSVFFLAYELNKSNAKYKIINDQLQKTQDSLDAALSQVNNLNESLKQDTFTLTRRVGNYDSLKSVLDTVMLLLRAAKTGEQPAVTISDNLKKLISTSPPTGRDPVFTVYVQCMPGFEKLMPPLVRELREKKYRVPRWEVVKDITFDPVIKYSYKEDADEAKKMATLINQSDDFFRKNPVKIQKISLKSPQRQIEIWVGEYRQKDLKQIIQQSTVEQKKL